MSERPTIEPHGSDLTTEELKRTAQQLATQEHAPAPLDRQAARSFEKLRSDDQVSAWLIQWGDDADTGFHDHDRSSGAVHVLSGRVREERLRLGGDPVTNEYGPGETFAIDASEIHRLVHVGDEPAVTVHAYSPPLTRMGAYVVEPSGALTRHSMSHEQELRPLETT